MTLVSKNGLSFIDLFAIEFEIRREGPLHLTELLECPLFGPVTGHLEVAFTCDGNLDFVSLFEIERFDDHSWKTNGQTVAPFGNLHKDTPILLYIYQSQEARFLTVGAIEAPSITFHIGTMTRATERGHRARANKWHSTPSTNSPLTHQPKTDPCFIGVFHTLNQRLAQLYY